MFASTLLKWQNVEQAEASTRRNLLGSGDRRDVTILQLPTGARYRSPPST
ncbi:hypothetical protein ACNKHW_07545 [Shigella flexneri]